MIRPACTGEFLINCRSSAEFNRHDAEPNSIVRSAFTLLELLLTLSVLAIIASLTLPGLTLLLGDRSLMRAGDQVAIEMNRTRVAAMRQGRVFILEAALEGHTIRKKPFFSAGDATEALDQTGSQSGLLNGASQASFTPTNLGKPTETFIGLPESVSVNSVSVASAARDSQISSQGLAGSAANASSGASGEAGLPSGNWSSPIFFYPDGTTSTAAVVIKEEGVGKVVVRLRGITGEAVASRVVGE